jgi:non-ribosomal peptide synthetase component F
MQSPGLQLQLLDIDNGTTKFDLTLFVWEANGQLVGKVEYNTDLFEEETITRFLAHYQHILEQMVQQPEQKLASVPLLAAEEQQRLLTWSNTQRICHDAICLHHAIEKQATERPMALAVVQGECMLNYAQLNARANALAHYLVSHGLQPEERIGLYMDCWNAGYTEGRGGLCSS